MEHMGNIGERGFSAIGGCHRAGKVQLQRPLGPIGTFVMQLNTTVGRIDGRRVNPVSEMHPRGGAVTIFE